MVSYEHLDPLPEKFLFHDFGIQTLSPGTTLSYEPQPEIRCWILINGQAEVREAEKKSELKAGDMVYILSGGTLVIQAVSMATFLWLKGLPEEKEEE